MTTVEALVLRYQTIPLVPGDTLLFGSMAEDPDNDAPFLTIQPTGGPPGDETSQERRALSRPTFQLMATASEYLVALALANQAFALSFAVNILLGDVFFLSITPKQSEPFDMPLDIRQRPRLAFNIETLRRG